jgi:hypothetical protein
MAKLINLIPNNKPKQNEALADMEVALPARVEKFLERLVQTIKSYNLPKKKEQAVIARVMDSMGITTSELNQAVQKLKKYDVVRRQRTGNDDHDFMGETLNELKDSRNIDDVNFSNDELDFLAALINNMGSGQHPWADSKTIGMFKIDYVKKLLVKGKIPSTYNSVLKSVSSKLQK